MKYPTTFNVDFPKESNRITAFFRMLLVIPVFIVWSVVAYFLCFVRLVIAVFIIFRCKYPQWLFDIVLNAVRFQYRVMSYFFMMRDEYPSIDEEQGVKLNLTYPNFNNDLAWFMPLLKWFLAIPHYIVLSFLSLLLIPVYIFVFFAILFTGKFPKIIFDFIEGVLRWKLRVNAYAFLLTTDKYPPFRLEE